MQKSEGLSSIVKLGQAFSLVGGVLFLAIVFTKN